MQPPLPFNPSPQKPLRSSLLDDLPPDIVEAITADVTPEMVKAYVGCLSTTPRFADEVRVLLRGQGWRWFPMEARRDSQLRFIRKIRDAALLSGYPVCSMNRGMVLGDAATLRKAAARARALAKGAEARAMALEALAEAASRG